MWVRVKDLLFLVAPNVLVLSMLWSRLSIQTDRIDVLCGEMRHVKRLTHVHQAKKDEYRQH